jgi:hypothetical protein
MEEKGFRYCETCEKWLGPSEIYLVNQIMQKR